MPLGHSGGGVVVTLESSTSIGLAGGNAAPAATTMDINYIGILYNTVLQRSGSADEVSAWSAQLDSGQLTRAQALADFEGSSEASSFVLPIARLYETFFQRMPDGAGLQGWVNLLRNGSLSLAQIADNFAHSSEFTQLYGASPDPTIYVTALYQNVLGRLPDQAGLHAWVSALTSGNLTMAQVALGFSQSQEFINSSTTGIDTWLTRAVNAQTGGVTPLGTEGVFQYGGHTYVVETIGGANAPSDTIVKLIGVPGDASSVHGPTI